MDPVLLVSAFLVAALLALVLVIRYHRDRMTELREEMREAALARRRAADAQARQAQQWAPVLARYPFDARTFRWLGGPIDGVQFDDDRIAFIVFTGEGRVPPDPRVRELVRAGRVDWVEVALGAEAPAQGQGATPPAPAPTGEP